ncbi:deoxyuridine 5'-triphosphate nucleotidohydrolase [Momordica charantia]|uniref:Deoxyuridine 5'-triphosphate nucleotidohydrolase n=1 Tax=Momordica charantia TaxID=3673 RepID=A0A6J1CSW8_MOMCH|nr:deoxyuridine 5'-triphosphate nucleotidohydrolase [Momordica charantia]
MAGKFGAIIDRGAFISGLPLFKSVSLASNYPPIHINFRLNSLCGFILSQTLTMAQNCSSEVNEPSPKVPKLAHENGESEKISSLSTLLRVKKLSEKAVLPSRASALSAGYDLSSATETKVPARGKVLVPTDLSIAIPEGTYARIAPRSGLALKHAIDVGAGVIDADYRGPVGVILFNHSDVDFEVKAGDRIAQLILEKIVTPEVLEVEDLDSTARGEGGFGSTGV